MNIQEWLTKTWHKTISGIVRDKIRCKDGFKVSVQASLWHYCTPKETLKDGSRYTHLELGYPNRTDEVIEPYRDGDVYPYVPVEKVNELIEKHGGIVTYNCSNCFFSEKEDAGYICMARKNTVSENGYCIKHTYRE